MSDDAVMRFSSNLCSSDLEDSMLRFASHLVFSSHHHALHSVLVRYIVFTLWHLFCFVLEQSAFQCIQVYQRTSVRREKSPIYHRASYGKRCYPNLVAEVYPQVICCNSIVDFCEPTVRMTHNIMLLPLQKLGNFVS